MNTISEYINSVKLIYNQPDSFASIVDNAGNVLHLSEAMRKLVSSTQQTPASLKEFDLIPREVTLEIEKFNQKILYTKQSLRYIYIMRNIAGDFTLFHGKKYPIYEENHYPVAVLTIHHKLRSIMCNVTTENIDYCFELPNHKLTDTEQLILFYISFGFSHGESYHFIVKHHEAKLKYENFKYYYKRILKAFQAPTMKELISQTCELKNCRFIPRKLLKSGIFVLKA